MTNLNELKKDLLKCEGVRAEYDALAEEFSIAEALQRYAEATGARLKISLEHLP